MEYTYFVRHKFMVSIDKGLKVYNGVDIIDGKPVPSGWKVGKMVQRCHQVYEADGMLVVVSNTDG